MIWITLYTIGYVLTFPEVFRYWDDSGGRSSEERVLTLLMAVTTTFWWPLMVLYRYALVPLADFFYAWLSK